MPAWTYDVPIRSHELFSSWLCRSAHRHGFSAYRFLSWRLEGVPVLKRDFERSRPEEPGLHKVSVHHPGVDELRNERRRARAESYAAISRLHVDGMPPRRKEQSGRRPMRMVSMATRDEVLAVLAGRYGSASRRERGRILDELVAPTGHHRKHAARVLRSGMPPSRRP